MGIILLECIRGVDYVGFVQVVAAIRHPDGGPAHHPLDGLWERLSVIARRDGSGVAAQEEAVDRWPDRA